MNKLVVFSIFIIFVFFGCGSKPDNSENDRQVIVSFSVRSLSDVRSNSTPDENAISKVILFGVDNKGSVVEKYPLTVNSSLSGMQLTISEQVKSLYAIANSSVSYEAANLSSLLALTEDFSNASVSPFLMSGKADVTVNNQVSIELIRSIAKVVISCGEGFLFQSVEVKNTPAKGYVFGQTTLSVPPSSIRINYSANSETTVYVAENSKQNPTTLIVKGTVDGKATEVSINFLSDGGLVDIVRNTCYWVNVALNGHDADISIDIREWDNVVIDPINIDF